MNLLNWQGSADNGRNAQNIVNFQTVNINAQNLGAGDTVLTLTDTAGTTLGNGLEGDANVGTTVNLKSAASGLVAGDVLHLISNASGINGILANNGQTQFTLKSTGFADGYKTLISMNPESDATSVDATIQGNMLNPQNKVLNEARVASLGFLNNGADLLNKQLANIEGQQAFGGMEGGHTHNSTGSSVDIDGVSFLTGVAHTWKQNTANLTAGAFIEAGWGDTATSNNIGGNQLNGNADAHYYGVGILGRYALTAGTAKGLYADASLRAGRLSNDYHNNDVTDAQGTRVAFDIDSTYYGAHAGVGYLWDVTNAYQLDMNARYMWSHINSNSATIAGDRFDFDSMDSHRTRLGARLNYTANTQFTPYAGLAWEYEFNGDASGSVLGYTMDEASLGGSTGIVELGVNFKPSANSKLTVNAGVTGYFGQREGAAGQFRMNYAF